MVTAIASSSSTCVLWLLRRNSIKNESPLLELIASLALSLSVSFGYAIALSPVASLAAFPYFDLLSVGAFAVAACLVSLAWEALARAWARQLLLGHHERLILLQTVLCTLHFALLERLPGAIWPQRSQLGVQEDAQQETWQKEVETSTPPLVVTVLMGGSALMAVLLLPAFFVYGRRSGKMASNPTATAATKQAAAGLATTSALSSSIAAQAPSLEVKRTRRAKSPREKKEKKQDSDIGKTPELFSVVSLPNAAGPVKHDHDELQPPASSWPASIAFYGVVACVIALFEYPLLWRILRQEPLQWGIGLTLRSDATKGLVAWWVVLLALSVYVPNALAKRLIPNLRLEEGGDARDSSDLSDAESSRFSLLPRHVNLLLRKIFHIVIALIVVPAIALGPSVHAMLSVGGAAALQVLLVLEFARALRVHPASASSALGAFMTSFTDSRDEGVFILTHLYLLGGCLVPFWIGYPVISDVDCEAAPASLDVTGSAAQACWWSASSLWPATLAAGTLAVGIGDACASAGGIAALSLSRAHRWGGSSGGGSAGKKTVEGTASFFVAVGACVIALSSMHVLTFDAPMASALSTGVAIAACAALALLETFTKGIDNAILPIWGWLFFEAARRLDVSARHLMHTV